MTADPHGTIISRADEAEQLLFSDIDPGEVERTKKCFPGRKRPQGCTLSLTSYQEIRVDERKNGFFCSFFSELTEKIPADQLFISGKTHAYM